MNAKIIKSCVIFVLCIAFANSAVAKEVKVPFVHIPSTVSEQSQAILRTLQDPSLKPSCPDADDFKAWKVLQEELEAFALERQKPIVELLRPDVRKIELGGVPVLDVRPRGWKKNDKTVVYTHGGAYTFFSAESTLLCAALLADATGLRVLSVDYTLAPNAKWQQVTDQVVSVFKALRDQGYAMKNIAILGDSAGGGLAAGSVLKMRDQGMEMPAAVVLWSPWSDITETGDSYATLKHADPAYRYDKHLKMAADAYANPKDQKHPYVSPVYGDYSKGFPPTLIQGGTKEIFLSNFVRHYQALDIAGQAVKLDLYEGMIHVFQAAFSASPESKRALAKTNAFLTQHL